VLGISDHVRPTIVVVNLKDVAHLIHASLPLWVRVVLDWIQRDGRVCSSSQVLRAQGGECHVSSLLHSIIHVGPNSPRGRDIDVDLVVLQAVLLIELTVVLWSSIPIASLHKSIPQQQREAVIVQTPRALAAILEGVVRVVSHLR
jgi:chorismate-pyruvate lyase